jgi:hypothetical protein
VKPLAGAIKDFLLDLERAIDHAREPNRLAGTGECFHALERHLGGGDAGGIGGGGGGGAAEEFAPGSQTYLRPLDNRVDGGGCVFPNFLVARTKGGSVVGVVGSAVWT